MAWLISLCVSLFSLSPLLSIPLPPLTILQSVLSVHDTVAQKNYDPELPPLPEDIDDDEDSVKIIRLVKNKEPLVRKFEFPFTYKANTSVKVGIGTMENSCLMATSVITVQLSAPHPTNYSFFKLFTGSNNQAWWWHGSHRRGPHHERWSSRQKWSVLVPFCFVNHLCVCVIIVNLPKSEG